jgi:hypothetical protein
MRTKRFFIWFAAVLGALAVLAAFSWPCVRHSYTVRDSGAYLVALLTGHVRTHYAPGYSEQAFAQVRVGMSRDEVHALLGEPLQRFSPDWKWPEAGWRYADQVTGTDHFHQRDISFSRAGRVTEITRGFYFD